MNIFESTFSYFPPLDAGLGEEGKVPDHPDALPPRAVSIRLYS